MTSARFAVSLALVLVSFAAPAQAQQRRVEVHFTPTHRAQIAVWVESADGSRFATLSLTQSVAYYGIGNRPGALQMNSGFRWPFGRREGVLPVWAHRRFEASGSAFPRVIFNGRRSEGNASSAGSAGEPRNTPDDYFCLSFQRERSGREALDAVTCASRFNSNKGRYLIDADAERGYGEPFEATPGAGMMRSLDTTSLYPPRRDVTPCFASGGNPSCGDHSDVAEFDADARAVMPTIDAITAATAPGDVAQVLVWDVPEDWPDGEYIFSVEINVEGDYNDAFNAITNPTPTNPSGQWDFWATNYGYAYRGQPSVVYSVPIVVSPAGASASTGSYAGYGSLQGEDGELHDPEAGTITEDPTAAPGSGADRLRVQDDGSRLRVVVPVWDVCAQPNPPASCGRECEPGDATCGEALICGDDFTCVGICDVPMTPDAVDALDAVTFEEESHSHEWARFSFNVPESARPIMRYEVRVGTEPIVDEASFQRALPALEAALESIELRVPTTGEAGERVEMVLGRLTPQTHYWIGVRAYDSCNAPSEISVVEIETTAIHFTTVSPCFVATAAYGTPMASEIGALRRFRDRHLRTHALGRGMVRAYYAFGPHLARAIEDDGALREAARTVLRPFVALARWLD